MHRFSSSSSHPISGHGDVECSRAEAVDVNSEGHRGALRQLETCRPVSVPVQRGGLPKPKAAAETIFLLSYLLLVTSKNAPGSDARSP